MPIPASSSSYTPSSSPPSFFFHLKFELFSSPSSNKPERTVSKASDSDNDSNDPAQDWRVDTISLSTIDMRPVASTRNSAPGASTGIQADPAGSAQGLTAVSKGRFVPSDPTNTELGWGVVHLYREGEETPGLYDDPSTAPHSLTRRRRGSVEESSPRDEDCTTLCILAVPSYLTPSDFLGFVGEKTRDLVSHFRMVRTARSNRYMVLMKFRDGRKARTWRREWNGKAFNSMEPENCHVVFVRSIQFQTPEGDSDPSSFPDMTNDPFTPRAPSTGRSTVGKPSSSSPSAAASLSTKPLAPPTPSLVELPTCPVCLERMDETTGLLTILCQHVFHCACLQKWKGCGCPVCRYTQGDGMVNGVGASGPSDPDMEKLCTVCGSEVNLWICLICGNIGCGRYDEAHAFSHYVETSHNFAMDLSTQRVWDYIGDEYVHRLIQNKPDGKLVDTSHAHHPPSRSGAAAAAPAADEEKLDDMSLEYTYLLTSQLDSQRLYFEEKIAQAADKASQASATAESATVAASRATDALAVLQSAHHTLEHDTIPTLERDRARADRRAEKASALAHRLQSDYRDEKAMNASLRERVDLLTAELEGLRTKDAAAKEKIADLEDQNRDLAAFISGSEKLKEIEGLEEGEVEGGEVSVSAAASTKQTGGSARKKGRKKKAGGGDGLGG